MTELRFEQLKAEILQKLHDRLDHRLVYHTAEHTNDVLLQAERIAIGENISDPRLLMLIRIAALFHDTGFLCTYVDHEKISCEFMFDSVDHNQFTKSEINLIREMIMATKIPHAPASLPEKILCDADLDYLGRNDFQNISNKLKKELFNYNMISDDLEWDHNQVAFIEKHRYFTVTSARERMPVKMKHLEMLKQKISIQNLK